MLREKLKALLGEKLYSLVTSRRAGALLTSILVLLLREWLGLDEATAITLAAVLGSWIVGDSLRKTQSPEKEPLAPQLR